MRTITPFRTAPLVTALAAILAMTSLAASAHPVPSQPASSAPNQRAGAPVPAAAPGKPNIVFILTDDLSTDLVEFMPNLKALIRRGTSFSRYSVSNSLCCPSRASILTGRYPHNTRMFSNRSPKGGYQRFKREGLERETYAVALQRAGYRTALMGKYLNEYRTTDAPAPGWDSWAVAGNGYRNYDYRLRVDDRVVEYGSRPEDYLTWVLSRRSTAFIESSAAAGEPFAIEIATFAPHAPATPARRDRTRFPRLEAPRPPSFNEANVSDKPAWVRRLPRLTRADKRNFDRRYRKRVRSVLAVDRMIGRLQDTLRRTGVARDTYLVVSSDNGFHLGQHRLPAGKQTAYTHDIVVPLVIDGPGVKTQRNPALVQNIDLGPTFAAIAGTTLPEADGRSMLPLLEGTTVSNWRTGALIEHRRTDGGAGDPDRQGARPPRYSALLTKYGTYVQYAGGAREYYRRRDTHQLRNVYSRLTTGQRAKIRARTARMTRCDGPAQCSRR
ncbi:MAG: sulfatase family protein [Nocardioides sp.]